MRNNFTNLTKAAVALIVAVALCFSGTTTKAQVSAYSFAQSAAAFVPLTGGTVLGIATNDDTSFPGLALGFTFNFNGTAYTTFSINPFVFTEKVV